MRFKLTKKQTEEERIETVKELLSEKLSKKNAQYLSERLIKGAESGLEIEDFDDWIGKRLMPQIVWLDKMDYTRAITRALPQALEFAATDFGSARQRDLGQLWTDTARGFLGEIGFKEFLQEKFEKRIEHDITMDKTLDDYVLSDIEYVIDPNGKKRRPRINVSVKTGKFNARWLDEYGSKKASVVDAFVFVRVGTVREHFVAFLKAISFLRDKLFPEAEKLGELTAQTGKELWERIPEFEPIPAYVTGYLMRSEIKLPIHDLRIKVSGRKNRRILITQGVGEFTESVLREDPRIEEVDPEGELPIVIDGINSEVGDSPHFYANTGALDFGIEKWGEFVERL